MSYDYFILVTELAWYLIIIANSRLALSVSFCGQLFEVKAWES